MANALNIAAFFRNVDICKYVLEYFARAFENQNKNKKILIRW